MEYIYKPKGVCSNLITIELDGETIRKVEFAGGCSGNGRGISQLVKGRKRWSKKNSERGKENALDCFSSHFKCGCAVLFTD